MPWHIKTPNGHKSTTDNSIKHKDAFSDTRLQINLNNESQNAPHKNIQPYVIRNRGIIPNLG
jgi:hypothetical protein